MRDDKAFLKHIIDEINYISDATKDQTLEQLIQNETLKRACLRSLEIIGEAAKNISAQFKGEHASIEWKEMAGLRDKLIHFYFGVDWKIVWDVLKIQIPKLRNKLEGLLREN